MKRLLIPLVLISIIAFLIDLYAFQGIIVLVSALPACRQAGILTGYWIFLGGLLLLLICCFYFFFPAKKHMGLLNKLFNTFLTVFVTLLAFSAVLSAGDIFRVILAIAHSAALPGQAFPPRSFAVSIVAAVFSLIPFLSLIFGVTRGKYHYKVHRVTLRLQGLPADFDGFKIVQISDVHAGSFDNRERVERGISMINGQDPDLFVFTGDLVNNRAEEIAPWVEVFSKIKAKSGQFSILGNHDYGDYVRWNSGEEKAANLDRLKAYHREIGFRLLLDEHITLHKGESHITLLGIENWGKGFGERGKLDKALAGVDKQDIKVLLSHDPSHWDEQVKNNPVKIHLTLSGHTHGMQFGIEALGIKWSPVKYRYPNWAGLAEENGRYLYVNRGFGFLGFSGRVGIWPEITVITLTGD